MRQIAAGPLEPTHVPVRRLPLDLLTGALIFLMDMSLELSFAALIFSGPLATFLPRGAGAVLFGAAVLSIVTALRSSLRGAIALPQDNPVIILALAAAGVVAALPDADAQTQFITVLAMLGVASVLTGSFLLLVGRFRLDSLMRYIPYPVLGGFLAGTGWLLASGAIQLMAGAGDGWGQLLMPDVLLRWLPGVLFGAALWGALRLRDNMLIVPAAVLGATALFWIMLAVSGTSADQAVAMGLLPAPFIDSALWQLPTMSELRMIEWRAVLAQAGSIAIVMVVSAAALLLNASGLELETRRDLNLNRELRTAGWANMLAGLGGSPPGYLTLSLSRLAVHAYGGSRTIGVVVGVLMLGTLAFGGRALSVFPVPVLGGLLFFLGLSFLMEWLYDALLRLPRAEYLIVFLIMLAIAVLGVLPGVGVGLVLAVLLFVLQYSRAVPTRSAVSCANYHSRVDRSSAERAYLNQHGDSVPILELQGFIFFGTVARLLETVSVCLEAEDGCASRVIVLDFRRVTGLDASAVVSFSRLKQLAWARGTTLLFTDLSPEARRLLARDVLELEGVVEFPDLDQGVEWCEERLLAEMPAPVAVADPEPVITELARLAAIRLGMPTATVRGLLEQHLERFETKTGDVLIHQDDPPKGVYLVESGAVSVWRRLPDGKRMRLRRARAGTVMGEFGLYLDTPASADVVVDQPGVIHFLSLENLAHLEREHAELAAVCHRWIASVLSGKLMSTLNTIDALIG